jgi:hypothetical protein
MAEGAAAGLKGFVKHFYFQIGQNFHKIFKPKLVFKKLPKEKCKME